MKELVIRAMETKLSLRYWNMNAKEDYHITYSCVLCYLVSFTWPCHTVYHEDAKLASNPVNIINF